MGKLLDLTGWISWSIVGLARLLNLIFPLIFYNITVISHHKHSRHLETQRNVQLHNLSTNISHSGASSRMNQQNMATLSTLRLSCFVTCVVLLVLALPWPRSCLAPPRIESQVNRGSPLADVGIGWIWIRSAMLDGHPTQYQMISTVHGCCHGSWFFITQGEGIIRRLIPVIRLDMCCVFGAQHWGNQPLTNHSKFAASRRPYHRGMFADSSPWIWVQVTITNNNQQE